VRGPAARPATARPRYGGGHSIFSGGAPPFFGNAAEYLNSVVGLGVGGQGFPTPPGFAFNTGAGTFGMAGSVTPWYLGYYPGIGGAAFGYAPPPHADNSGADSDYDDARFEADLRLFTRFEDTPPPETPGVGGELRVDGTASPGVTVSDAGRAASDLAPQGGANVLRHGGEPAVCFLTQGEVSAESDTSRGTSYTGGSPSCARSC
jgi:hypothetical protein